MVNIPSDPPVFVIGVRHEIQIRRPDRDRGAECPEREREIERFATYLSAVIRDEGIIVAGEEMFHSALRGGMSVLAQECAKLGVRHRFCDIEPEERPRFGILDDPCPSAWELNFLANGPPREAVWMNRLLADEPPVALFVCGEKHVDSVVARLHDRKRLPLVLVRAWGWSLPIRTI